MRVHQQLVTLLRESLRGVTVLGDRGDPGPYQCDAVLLSLPRLFKTRLETIPAGVPYLRAPVEATQRWGNALQDEGPQGRRDVGGQSRTYQRSSPFVDLARWRRCLPVGCIVREPAGRTRAADLKKLKRAKASISIEDLSPR